MSFFCPSSYAKKKGARPLSTIVDTYRVRKNNNKDEAATGLIKRQPIHKNPIQLEVVQNFFPCSALELPVRAGEKVIFIKNEGAWVFVRAHNGSNGYIPRRHCRILESPNNLNVYGSISNLSDASFYKEQSSYKNEIRHTRGGQNQMHHGRDRAVTEIHHTKLRVPYDTFHPRGGSANDIYHTRSGGHNENYHTRDSGHNDIYHTRDSGHNEIINNVKNTHHDKRIKHDKNLGRYKTLEEYHDTSSSASPASSISNDYLHENNEGHYQKIKPRMRKISPTKPPRMKYLKKEELITKTPVCGRKCDKGCKHGLDIKEDIGKVTIVTNSSVDINNSKTNVRTQYENIEELTVSDESNINNEQRSSAIQIGSVISVSSGIRNTDLTNTSESDCEENSLTESITQNSHHNKNNIDFNNNLPLSKIHSSILDLVRETENSLNISRDLLEPRDITRPNSNSVTKQCGHPELIVIKGYVKHSETDITVECGDYARIINDTKYEDWIYVVTENEEEGFIPSNCVVKHQCQDCNKSNESENSLENEQLSLASMVQMIVHENFAGSEHDDLYVCIGEFVYMATQKQSIEDWVWVYSPKQKQWGYVPDNILKEVKDVCPV